MPTHSQKEKRKHTHTLAHWNWANERTNGEANCCLHILLLYLALELLLFTLLHCKSGDDHITPYTDAKAKAYVYAAIAFR